MSHLQKLSPPTHDSVLLSLVAPNMLVLDGKITLRDPAAELGPFFRAVHEAAKKDGLSTLTVDMAGLEFVNSSSIRLVIDWETWLKNEAPPRYTLQFLMNRTITWQRTSLVALTALASDVVAVEHKE